MKTKSIKQKILINASPEEVYESLLDSKKHSAFTKDKAKINRKIGGKFKAYGNYISGKNMILLKNKIIVQYWRGSDWPKLHYSTVKFELKNKKGKTELIFSQEGIPERLEMNITRKDWDRYYWIPLKEYLEN